MSLFLPATRIWLHMSMCPSMAIFDIEISQFTTLVHVVVLPGGAFWVGVSLSLVTQLLSWTAILRLTQRFCIGWPHPRTTVPLGPSPSLYICINGIHCTYIWLTIHHILYLLVLTLPMLLKVPIIILTQHILAPDSEIRLCPIYTGTL